MTKPRTDSRLSTLLVPLAGVLSPWDTSVGGRSAALREG